MRTSIVSGPDNLVPLDRERRENSIEGCSKIMVGSFSSGIAQLQGKSSRPLVFDRFTWDVDCNTILTTYDPDDHRFSISSMIKITDVRKTFKVREI